MTWAVKRTDTFLDSLKAIRKNKEALAELDKYQESIDWYLHRMKLKKWLILTGLTIVRLPMTETNSYF